MPLRPQGYYNFTFRCQSIEKQNMQPNMLKSNQAEQKILQKQKNINLKKNEIGRQSYDDLNLKLNSNKFQQMQNRDFSNFGKKKSTNNNMLSKSNNFNQCNTDRNEKQQFGRYLKTQYQQQDNDEIQIAPIIQNCQIIKSQYQSSQQIQQEIQNKCYRRQKIVQRPQKSVHSSLNCEAGQLKYKNPMITTHKQFNQINNNNYHFQRQQQKKLKNQIVNSIIMNSRVQLMKSCDFMNKKTQNHLKCINHPDKQGNYRLKSPQEQDQQTDYYCANCAINLTKQHFDVIQVTINDKFNIRNIEDYQNIGLYDSIEIHKEKVNKQTNFGNIEKHLNQLQIKVNKKLQLFNRKSQDMRKIDRKLELTKNNYDQIIEILQQMRRQQEQKQQQLKKQKILDINHKKYELQTLLTQIKQTNNYLFNQRNKMMALKKTQFNMIFSQYMKKITSYEEYLKRLQKTQLDNQIANFDLNMSAEQIDQDKMIQDIFDQMYQKLTAYKLQAIKYQGSKNENENTKYINEQFTKRQVQSIEQVDESRASAGFYCYEEEQQKNPPPFRTLFNDNYGSKIPQNHQDSFYMNQSTPQNIRQLKESNTFQHYRNKHANNNFNKILKQKN